MEFKPFKKRFSELNSLKAEKGNILVSEPFMKDEYFKRSVVYLCESNAEGTVGFILNDPLGIHLKDVIKDDLNFNAPLYLGGPVQTENLFFIHRCPDLEDSLPISKDVFWSGDFERLKEKIKLGQVTESEVRFFLGYSGWDPEQLKSELTEQSWLIGQLDTPKIFSLNTENLWKKSLQQMGEIQAMLATFPNDPSLN